MPLRIILESTAHLDKNSLLIRSLTSPVAIAILKGLVLDQLGEVNASVKI
jgi:hypothetical protein